MWLDAVESRGKVKNNPACVLYVFFSSSFLTGTNPPPPSHLCSPQCERRISYSTTITLRKDKWSESVLSRRGGHTCTYLNGHGTITAVEWAQFPVQPRSWFSDCSPVVQVRYKTNRNLKPEGSSDLPNLLQLEHVLHASKLQSNVRMNRSAAALVSFSGCFVLRQGISAPLCLFVETKRRKFEIWHIVKDEVFMASHRGSRANVWLTVTVVSLYPCLKQSLIKSNYPSLWIPKNSERSEMLRSKLSCFLSDSSNLSGNLPLANALQTSSNWLYVDRLMDASHLTVE